MNEQQMDTLAQKLTAIEKQLRAVNASAWDKLDAVDFARLSKARGQLQGEIDHLEILQGKTPQVVR